MGQEFYSFDYNKDLAFISGVKSFHGINSHSFLQCYLFHVLLTRLNTFESYGLFCFPSPSSLEVLKKDCVRISWADPEWGGFTNSSLTVLASPDEAT
jgi:hypothetical protein